MGAPRALRVSELPASPLKREWLHGTHLIRGAVSLLVSPGGRGKSSWLLACGMACASGRTLLGAHVFGGPLRVLYVNAEDGGDELARRIRAGMAHHGLTDHDLNTLRVVGADRFGLSLLQGDRSGPALNPAGWDAFGALLDIERPDVVILDPLVSLMGGVSLNDNAAAALLQARLVQWAAQRRIGFFVAHHTAKFRETNTADAAMGAASFVNLARISLSLEAISEGDAPKLGVPPWEARSILRLVGTKQNLSKPSVDDAYFRLVSVTLPNAAPPVYPNGDEVGVVEVFNPTLAGSPYPAVMVDTALDVIRQAQPPLSPRDAPGSLAGVLSPIAGRVVTTKDAKALLDHLRGTGDIRIEDVSIPRAGRGAYHRQGVVAPKPPGGGNSP